MRGRVGSQFSSYLVLATLLAILAAFLLYPIWLTLRGAIFDDEGRFVSHALIETIANPTWRTGLLNATLVATCTTLIAILIAFPLAVVSSRSTWRGKGIVTTLLLAPLILPPFVGAIGLRQLLGQGGAINALLQGIGLTHGPIDFLGRGGFAMLVLVEAFALYPILYLNLAAALANLDPALEDAATNLGASRWTRFRRIVLPLVRPGLFAGATIVFIWSFTELGTPLLLEYYQVTPVQIFNGIKEMETSRQPYALTAVMLLSAIGFYILGKTLLGRQSYAMYSKAATGSREVKLDGRKTLAANLLFGAVIGLAILPHLGVLLTSLTASGQWYRSVVPQHWTLDHFSTALTNPLSAGAIRNSLLLAGVAVVVDLIIGLMVARILVRSRIRGRWLLDALVMLPLAVPGLVMAFGYVAMTLEWPFHGAMPGWLAALLGWLPDGVVGWLNSAPLKPVGDVLGATPNPLPLLVLAYAIRRLPYVVRSAVAGLEQTSVELEEAALNLGASRFTMTRRVVLPLIVANLVAGGLLAFAFAMLEVSDSLILAQREAHYPITKAIYTFADRLGDGPYVASAMGVWGMALLAVCLVGASMVLGKKMGQMFRA
ncbi:MAG: iron ABC transporter permease [Phycisphaerae bacterium]|jgi:iron(III) transport system permease protein|nr:iron ABC transporter permease [Phycisphaerae bacterium]